MYKIGLNFSSLKNQRQEFKVFRMVRGSSEEKIEDDSIFGNRLPRTIGDDEYENYWISFSERRGFEEFECTLDVNHYLTKRYLTNLILETSKNKNLSKDVYKEKGTKFNRVCFVLREHPEGKEIVWVEPFYLKQTQEFGYLIDYKFDVENKTGYSRKIQILSLSLNSIGRSNTQLTSDKYKKIQFFAKKFYRVLFQESYLDFGPIVELDSIILEPKAFIGRNRKIIDHQSKVRSIGPFKEISDQVNVIFLHKESERHMLANFYKDLQHELVTVFNCNVNLHGHKCTEITLDEIQSVKTKIGEQNFENVIVIVLKKNQEEDNEMYYTVKYHFCIADIPVQFINYDTLKNKYSVRDFSLQIFSKIGGVPWIVNTNGQKTLIIGLAQSFRFTGEGDDRKMKRYYAYSILMDNSGLFHSVKIVSDNVDKSTYLENLRKSIADILRENMNVYSSIVLHAPFKISEEEVKKIDQALTSVKSEVDFLVLRLNQYNKYYGYNKQVNSLIPFESSLMQIAKKEYLLWTEGITLSNKNATKRYSGPFHVEVLYDNQERNDYRVYMQDLINLSGMNWRAYNSKSVPLSIQYCDLITDFVREFQERGFPQLTEDNLKPWFL